ncbi:MFS transporter [Limtongia smithiae]|uniref:MFS transporter n=1 Tax=Limtongia smithiae TaxID=1125753 RepID=UPI0034CF4FAE
MTPDAEKVPSTPGAATENYNEDPKLWPTWIKIVALANICLCVFVGDTYVSGLTTGFDELAVAFQISNFGKIADLVYWSVFMQGVSNLFWMPIALCYGKRLVMILTLSIFVAGSIWSGVANSFNSLMGARVVSAFGLGPVFSLGPSIIGDLFLERNFAAAMAVYAICLSAGSQIGPAIAGYMIAARGWRWFFYLLVILSAVNLIFVVLSFPETTYRRVYFADETAADYEEKGNEDSRVEAIESVDARTQDRTPAKFSFRKNVFFLRHPCVEGGSPKKLFSIFLVPFAFILVPAVLFSAILFGLVMGWVIVISTLVPTLFSPAPYYFTSKSIGLFSLSSFIGSFLSLPFAGVLTDTLSRYLRNRNGGVHKPEHRLPALIMPMIICPAGLFLFGFTTAKQDSYVLPAIGFSLQSTGLAMVPSTMLSYVVDSFPETSGEAMVLIHAGKSVVGFGLALRASDWLAASGVRDQFITMACIEFALIGILGSILFIYGPRLRHMARHSKMFSKYQADSL